MKFVGDYGNKVPVAGPYISQGMGIVGHLLTIAASLNKDNSLLNVVKSYYVNGLDVEGETLQTGLYDIVENGPDAESDKIQLSIEILKVPPAKAKET